MSFCAICGRDHPPGSCTHVEVGLPVPRPRKKHEVSKPSTKDKLLFALLLLPVALAILGLALTR